MVKTAKDYVKEVEEFKGVMSDLININGVDTFDENTYKLFKTSLKLIDLSNELIVEMACSLDTIEHKLDLLNQKTK